MNRLLAVATVLGVCATGTARPAAADAPRQDDVFVACRSQFAAKPDDYDSAYCFYQTAVQHKAWQAGADVFEALMREHPNNLWLPLACGHLYRERDPARTDRLYRRAADGFRRDGHRAGEIVARSNLRNFLFLKGRMREAAAEIDRVASLEPVVNDPLLKAQIWTLQALHVQDTGGDLGLAYRLLKQAERATVPAGSYRLQRNTLSSLAMVAFRLGRLDEALEVYATLERMAIAERDPRQLASARFNLLNVMSMKETLLPTVGSRQRLMALARRSLDAGVAGDHLVVSMKAHRAIAALLAQDGEARGEALLHVRSCLELAEKARQPHDEAVCSWLEARLTAESDRATADAAVRRAVAATTRANSPMTQAYSAGRHMRLSWDTKPRTEAIRDSLTAIDAIETLRGLQEDGASSAELFSIWSLDYHWLSGRLLRDGGDGALDLAFSITERLRARSLLDRVNGPARRLPATHPAVTSRRAALEAISVAQRRLMDPAVTEAERRAAVKDLEELEAREQEADRQIGLASRAGDHASPAFARLADVQATLAEHEALLSFQVGIWNTYEGEFGGGSWVIAITRDGRSVHRIPDRSELAPIVPVFNGLLARGDQMGTAAAVRLHNDLLAAALRALPARVTRLIVVPDGAVHQLSFDVLRARPEAEPLASQYELVLAPSATLWLHWRGRPGSRARRGALALADPALDSGTTAASAERSALLLRGVSVGPLPHARRESRALQRHVSSAEALVGSHASEHALKTRNLRDYTILHFAAHAVSDESRPERSAVLLSPGSAAEDGLLQAREIEELDLDARVIVLSACQTASGAVLNGEGVLSLARAFFAAGARAVVGSRWPIRDEDAATLFDTFYRGLGRGATVAAALRDAKLEAMQAGRPATAWAGLVVLGDGTVRPFPESASADARADASVIGATLALAVLLALTVTRSLLRRQPRPAR